MSPSKMNAMVDDKAKRAPQDTKLISLTEDYEIDYWTEKFGVTPRKVSPRLCAGSGTPPRRWKSAAGCSLVFRHEFTRATDRRVR
jgi:hypothetical protein